MPHPSCTILRVPTSELVRHANVLGRFERGSARILTIPVTSSSHRGAYYVEEAYEVGSGGCLHVQQGGIRTSQSIGINHDRWTRITVLTVACSIGFLFSIPASATIVSGQVAGEDNLPRYWEIHAWLLSRGAALFVTTYLALWLKFLQESRGLSSPRWPRRFRRCGTRRTSTSVQRA